VVLLARLTSHWHGIRTWLLLREAAPNVARAGSPALVVLADVGRVESITSEAVDWLEPLDGEDLENTIVLHEVAQQAWVLARDGAGRPSCARARARATVTGPSCGRHAWRGHDPIRAAPPWSSNRPGASTSPCAPAPAPADRSRTRSDPTAPHRLVDPWIAGRLLIMPETLRGHVKAVFAKLGVNCRPQLAALLFQEPMISSSSSIM
jgi:hypothetical protein